MRSAFMNISLGIYEFHKLFALVNSICLLVLITLFVVFAKSGILSAPIFIIGILFADLIICFVISFVWFTKAERMLLEGGVRLWTIKRTAVALFFPLACTLTGIYTIFFNAKTHIAITMIMVLVGYLGFELGDMAKIAVRYRRRT